MTNADIVCVIEAVERSPSILALLVAEASPSVLKRRPEPSKWSIHEHAVHVTQIQAMMEHRLQRMLTEDVPEIEPYFPDQHDVPGALLEADLGQALEAFRTDRERLGERLRALSVDEWNRTADHTEYHNYSVYIMFRHLAMHDLFHAYRIEELLLTK